MSIAVEASAASAAEPTEPVQLPVGPVFRFLRAVDRMVLKLEEGLVIVLTVFMVGTVMVQVIGRMFGLTVPWAMEAGVFAMLAMSLLAGSITTYYRRHIAIDVLSRLMPGPMRTVLATFIDLTAVVLLVYLLRVSLFFVSINHEWGLVSTALKIPFWWLQTFIPAALAIIAFRFILAFVEDLKRIRHRQWLSADGVQHGIEPRI